jgi:hypothetical protein
MPALEEQPKTIEENIEACLSESGSGGLYALSSRMEMFGNLYQWKILPHGELEQDVLELIATSLEKIPSFLANFSGSETTNANEKPVVDRAALKEYILSGDPVLLKQIGSLGDTSRMILQFYESAKEHGDTEHQKELIRNLAETIQKSEVLFQEIHDKFKPEQ